MTRRVIAAVAACALAALLATLLAACSAPSAGRASPAAGGHRSASPAGSAVTRFVVTGSRPVQPNGSQDTDAQAPGAACDAATLQSDKDLGSEIAGGFALAGFPTAAALLTRFLAGTGTEVDYPAGSAIARQARDSSAFQAVNAAVQAAVQATAQARLRAGTLRVILTPAQLPAVAFESTATDLYWAFRGTQGLSVTGGGTLAHGRLTGTLTYVIRDSYGFPADDILDNFGPPMRYLQTACGAPQHPGGAHWFPDTITITVPFSQPA